MTNRLSFDDWYNKFEEQIGDAEYEAFMESGAYLDSDREAFSEKFVEDAYTSYLKSCDEAEIEAAGY